MEADAGGFPVLIGWAEPRLPSFVEGPRANLTFFFLAEGGDAHSLAATGILSVWSES